MNDRLREIPVAENYKLLRFKSLLNFTLVVILLINLSWPALGTEVSAEDDDLLGLISNILGLDVGEFSRLIASLSKEQKVRLREEVLVMDSIEDVSLEPVNYEIKLYGDKSMQEFLDSVVKNTFPYVYHQEIMMSQHFVLFVPKDDERFNRWVDVGEGKEENLSYILKLLELAYLYNRALGSDVELVEYYPVLVGALGGAEFNVSSWPFTYISIPYTAVGTLGSAKTVPFHEGTHLMMMEGRATYPDRDAFGLQEASAYALEGLLLSEDFAERALGTMVAIQFDDFLTGAERVVDSDSYTLYGIVYSALERGYSLLASYYRVYEGETEVPDFRKVLADLDAQVGATEPSILAGFYIGALNSISGKGLYSFPTSHIYSQAIPAIENLPVADIDDLHIFPNGIGEARYYNLIPGRNFLPRVPPGQEGYLVTLVRNGGNSEVTAVERIEGDVLVSVDNETVFLIVNTDYR